MYNIYVLRDKKFKKVVDVFVGQLPIEDVLVNLKRFVSNDKLQVSLYVGCELCCLSGIDKDYDLIGDIKLKPVEVVNLDEELAPLFKEPEEKKE